MTLVGCDLHSRKQQVAVLDTRTGELVEQELAHDGDAVERFYRALPPPVTIGIETTGYTQWFHALMHRLGHTVLVGEAAKIRAMVVRKTKTDRRDARHLLDLLNTTASQRCGSRSRHPGSARPDRAPRPAGPDADDGQERPAGDRPQPAAGAPLGVVDPAGLAQLQALALPRTRRAGAMTAWRCSPG